MQRSNSNNSPRARLARERHQVRRMRQISWLTTTTHNRLQTEEDCGAGCSALQTAPHGRENLSHSIPVLDPGSMECNMKALPRLATMARDESFNAELGGAAIRHHLADPSSSIVRRLLIETVARSPGLVMRSMSHLTQPSRGPPCFMEDDIDRLVMWPAMWSRRL